MTSNPPSGRRLLAAALALVLLGGCAVHLNRKPQVPAIEMFGGDYGVFATPPTNLPIYWIYGVRKFRVNREAVLLGFRPTVLPPGVAVLNARLTYFRAVTQHAIQAYVGGLCIDYWPPAGYGPTYPVAGTYVYPGEIIALTSYLRLVPGRYDVDGYAFDYRDVDTGKRVELRRDHGSKVLVEFPKRGTAPCKSRGADDDWVKPWPAPTPSHRPRPTPSAAPA